MIKQAFWDGFEKNAAVRSEIVGTVLSGPAHIEKEHDRVLKAVKGKNWAQAVKRDY